MKKFLLLSISTLFIAGCATAYQPMGPTGGYAEMQLNQTTYQVAARGNGYTPKGTVDAMVLRRSAELTLNNGYKYFIIEGGGSQQLTSSFVVSNPSATTNGFGDLSDNSMYYNQTTTYNPGTVETINRTLDQITISMTNTYSSNVFDAALIIKQTNFLVKNNIQN